ncbi:MAG: MFS transporter [Bryobacteraceae bacterium]|nr:MFS transporter [Bryobacteraceae bacterium]
MQVPIRYWILALLSFSTLVNYLDRQTLSVVVPMLRTEMSLSSAEYGNITTAFLIAYSAGQILAGGVVDRIGVRWGLAIFAGVWTLAAIAHGFAQTAGQLLALRILLGLGEAGNWPAGVKAVSEWFSKSERAFSMGIFDGGSALGAILAPPLVAALTLTFGWRAAFFATGALGFVWLGLWLVFYRSSPTATAAPSKPGVVWEILVNQQLWSLMATRLLATPVWWFYVFWLPDYLGKGRGLSLREIGLFGWVPYVTVDLGKLVGGRLSDRLIAQGYESAISRKVVMGGAALCMTGGLFVVEAASAASALAWVSLATFGFGMWSANILALHADLFDSSTIASAVGWTTAASSIGGAAFTWLTGRVVDSQGYGLVFAMAGSAALFAFGVLWFGVFTPTRREAVT